MSDLDKLVEFLKLSYDVSWSQYDDIIRYTWSGYIVTGRRVVVEYINDTKTIEYRAKHGLTYMESHTHMGFMNGMVNIKWIRGNNNIVQIPIGECIDFLVDKRFCSKEVIRDYKLNSILG